MNYDSSVNLLIQTCTITEQRSPAARIFPFTTPRLAKDPTSLQSRGIGCSFLYSKTVQLEGGRPLASILSSSSESPGLYINFPIHLTRKLQALQDRLYIVSHMRALHWSQPTNSMENIVLEKLTDAYLVKIFTAFYLTRISITTYTRTHHCPILNDMTAAHTFTP
jgi:hypothetical protein